MTQVNRRNGNSGRSAFTLIELLVVMAIISLLIAILLPSLSGARRAGKRVTCLAHLKEIGRGVQEYGGENEDWIVGSPAGSGAYLAPIDPATGAPVQAPVAHGPCVQRWDFMGPLAKMWGADANWPQLDGSPQKVADRFNAMRNDKLFLCAGNDWLATHFSGPNAGVGPMVSYNTVRYMLWVRETGAPSEEWVSWYWTGNPASDHEERPPRGWKPSITRIGAASRKIFCADGSRFATTDIAPDYDLTLHATYGGAFSDASTFSDYSRSWERKRAPGNGSGSGVDARAYAFRHSTGVPNPGAPADSYRANFLFFDGHAETMGDLESSNPQFWLPAGSRLEVTQHIYNDTRARFGLQGNFAIGN